MVAPSLGQLAQDVLTDGAKALKAFTLQPLHPVAPMLAQPAGDVEALGEGEVKLTTIVRERYGASSDKAAMFRFGCVSGGASL